MALTSVDGVVADLKETEQELAQAQDSIIVALENGSKLDDIKRLERKVAEITDKRDDLVETKTFMVNRERQRAERDNKTLSTAYYISQWHPTLTTDDVSNLALHAHNKNESLGITGALYVFRGWFASYLEGEDSALDSTLSRIVRDERHTGFAILKRDRGLPASTPRKIPDLGLKLQWINDEANAATRHEATIIASLCQQLALTSYVPRSIMTQVEQLEQHRSHGRASDEVEQTLSLRARDSAKCPVQEHYMACLAPCCDSFWSNTYAPRCIEAVVKVAKQVFERPTEDSHFTAVGGDFGSTAPAQHLGSVLLPHGPERLFVACGRFAEEAVKRCVLFIKKLEEEYPKETSIYQPTIALHVGEIQAPVNGRIVVVGSMLRYLQQLSVVAKQEAIPVAVGFRVADEAHRKGLVSYGHFLINQTPDEVFVSTEFNKARWVLDAADMFADVPLNNEGARSSETASTILGSAEAEGGVPQLIPKDGAKKVEKPAAISTSNDELNVEPPRNFVEERTVRAEFEQLFPDEKDTIPLETYAAYYQGMDQMGVNETVGEMEGKLGAFQSGRDKTATLSSGKQSPNAAMAARRVHYDQFAMMYYRKLAGI